MFKRTILLLLALAGTSVNAVAAENGNYILGPGDVINITVYGEEDLTIEERRIDTREMLEYPYLDKISTKGKTPDQLQQEITNGLKGRVLINPRVSVSIDQYRNFYINGVVNKPGAYEYQPGLTVEQAVSIAEGFTAKYRNSKGIYIIRANETKNMDGDELEAYLEEQKESRLSDRVGPGDTVYIVTRLFGMKR
ncbi:polysaccharide biosynthesis/export family protein [Vibrio maerlii]|uniref:polysaccharide biosynthesis/export family protein n=1 Tax=Vibrio maerlii TaxID=2231648 RepID=UPI000E3B5A1D|nr:polysaccharide biosynthesis/export family protein [Vibrio maerlii]